MSKTQREILDMILNDPSITHIEMDQRFSMTEKTAKRTTKALREIGFIKREGSDKSVHRTIIAMHEE